MKLGWIVMGQTFSHKDKLKEMGFWWHPNEKIWSKMMAEGGHDRQAHDEEESILKSMIGVTFAGVDYDCLREGNESWLLQEIKELKQEKAVIPVEQQKKWTEKKQVEVENTEIASATLFHGNTVEVGEIIEIESWQARSIKKRSLKNFVCRNLRIIKIKKETDGAMLLEVENVAMISNSCMMCGRNLDTEVSRATGIGPLCAKKAGVKRYSLAQADGVLNELDEIARSEGPFECWVSKRAIIGKK